MVLAGFLRGSEVHLKGSALQCRGCKTNGCRVMAKLRWLGCVLHSKRSSNAITWTKKGEKNHAALLPQGKDSFAFEKEFECNNFGK